MKATIQRPLTPSYVIDMADLCLNLPSRAGDIAVLRQVNLRVTLGEAVSLVGPSGSGKTSLLMVAGGLQPASSGHLSIQGQNLIGKNENTLAKFRRENIGIIFQSFHLIPTMTALENVAIPLEFLKIPEALAIARTRLEQVGLSHRLSHYPSQLSGGEQQRVAIARALSNDVKLLLADEPTGNLDQETGQQIVNLLFELKEQTQATLLLITHDRLVAERCTRIAEMRDGRIIKDEIR